MEAMGLQLAERKTLAELEKVIERHKLSFVEVGEALTRIRDERLYRDTHATFEGYCQERWGWGRTRAHRLIEAAEVAQNIAPALPVGNIRGANERQLRPLVGLEPEAQRAAWEEAKATAPGGVITAAHVEAVVKRQEPPHLQTRRTPLWLFKQLDAAFGPFVLDAFAEPHNALCGRFYTREQDGCVQPWADVTFANPEFEDMAQPLDQAVKQANVGRRSCIIGPVGCSQAWYHELAIQGTIYVPTCRINFDLPDGTPTRGADRDSIVVCFGKDHANPDWRKGIFRVRQLKLVRPA